MGYEHLSITPEMESDEVRESNAKNLLPIPSECEVTLEDKRECDELVYESPSTIDVYDNHFEILFDSNNHDLSSDDESFEDIEYVDASVPDPAIASIEENVNHQEQEEINLEEISQTRSDNTTTHATDSLPEYDSFRFEIELDQEELFNVVMNDISDDPSIPRPPPEPPYDDFDLEPEAISTVMKNIDESFDPGGEIFISTRNEDVDHFPFMFVTQIFLSCLVLPEISTLFLTAESKDTIFDPGISD
nr:hypothetical protein [Tanacetum cinerariifolium]